MYINDRSTLNGVQDYIVRSLFINSLPGNDVEVGWAAGVGIIPNNNPTPYAEWINRGADSFIQATGQILSTNSYLTFKVENVGNAGIWRFYLDNQSSPFNYSPTMNFNNGLPATNSEHDSTCDSLWSHMYGLQDQPNIGHWQNYTNLQCYIDTSVNQWYFDRISNNEEYVSLNTGITC